MDSVTALIVSADPLQIDLLRRALAQAGCQDVLHVPSIDAPLPPREVDLAVLDLGLAAIEMIAGIAKLARRLRGAPILVVVPERALEPAFEAGASDGITLPVRSTELVARLRSALRLRAKEQRRAARDRKMSDAMQKLQRENHDLERRVCVDGLTGIANRGHALALLAAECKRARREGAPLSLVMVDLDAFHAFNERYGHPGGDRCLQHVCDAMVHCLRRPSDLLGRYGGEEFLAVLPGTNACGAAIVAERLRAAVEALAIPHASSPCARVVTISVGFASLGPSLCTAEQLVAAADAAMLRAKTAGRNRVVGEAQPTTALRLPAYQWKRFAPVIADPWFADRIPAFLAATREDAVVVARAARDRMLDLAALFARKLKASAVEYGFDQLRRTAAELELATRGADAAAIAEYANEIVQYVDHVQVVYRRPVEAPAEPVAPADSEAAD